MKKNWSILLSLAYIISPIDLLPEAFLGPLGIVDDLPIVIGLLVVAVFRIWHSTDNHNPSNQAENASNLHQKSRVNQETRVNTDIEVKDSTE